MGPDCQTMKCFSTRVWTRSNSNLQRSNWNSARNSRSLYPGYKTKNYIKTFEKLTFYDWILRPVKSNKIGSFISTNQKKRIFSPPQIQTGIFTVKSEKHGPLGYSVAPLPVLTKGISRANGGIIGRLKPDGIIWVVSKLFLEDVRPYFFDSNTFCYILWLKIY